MLSQNWQQILSYIYMYKYIFINIYIRQLKYEKSAERFTVYNIVILFGQKKASTVH